MIPIILSSKAEDWSDNPYGTFYWNCGCATECVVEETRNGDYTCTLTAPLITDDNGIKVIDWIKKYNVIYAKPNLYNSPQRFIIHTVESDGRTITAYANHEWDILKNISCRPIPSQSNIENVMDYIASNNNKTALFGNAFTLEGFINGSSSGGNAFVQTEISNVKDTVLNAVEYFDGELYVDSRNVYVYVPTRGEDTNVHIGYKRNITNIDYEDNSDDAYNGVVPYFCNDDTYVRADSTSYDMTTISFPCNYLKDVTSEYTEDDIPSSSDLNTRQAAEASTVSAAGTTNISVSVVVTEDDLDMLDLKLCDTVVLDYEPLGISNKRIQFTSYAYDVLAEQYTDMTFGENEKLSKTLIAQEKASRTYQKVKKSTSNKYNFTFTRNGKYVTCTQTGSIKPTATSQTLTSYIPLGYRPTATKTVKASDPEKSGTTATYKFYKSGNIVITHASGLVQGSRNFTIGWITKDAYPRNGYKT